ncbi:hypothetical protein CEP52_006912 [Fusarium oligoseptatum]|uniref:Uncharacterized protein n=1 Tax=Fusarium oligoseptatum TaxID=2604345 RepID=A0A428TQG4_9HYPO|nr:hypothetical protein CEP52_006912 [Fusarium oligoseptatum]
MNDSRSIITNPIGLNNYLKQCLFPSTAKNEKREGEDGIPKRKIWGIRRGLFIAAVVIALIVIGAAVGGGVGGSMAAKKGTSKEAAVTSSTGEEDATSSWETTSTPTPVRTTRTRTTNTAKKSESTPRVDDVSAGADRIHDNKRSTKFNSSLCRRNSGTG